MSRADALTQRLADLVAFDTQNPMGDERPLALKLANDLRAAGAASVDLFETARHHSVYARFGSTPPRLLVNAHIDTVPANSGYSSPPHKLTRRAERLYGLGTADTKGGMAAVLEALAVLAAGGRPPRDVGILFSGDEERSNTAIKDFLTSDRARGIERAVVCEPTGCRVGKRHRGIGAAEVTATSPGGHSSLADGLPSPVVTLARVAVALDAMAARHRPVGPAGFPGICLNVAAIEGGVAFNVIPSSAKLLMSLRPAPGVDVHALLAEAEAEARKAAGSEAVTWGLITANPSFATRDVSAFHKLMGTTEAVDLPYWTEAALCASYGIDAVVYGPGHVGQAHAADEFVDLAQLEEACDTFLRVLSS